MRPEKVELVNTLEAKLKDAKGVCLADFTGMTVERMSDLRVRCRKAGVEFKVIKNTLTRRALSEDLRAPMDPYLVGPTAVALSLTDEVAPAKVLADFAKEFQSPKIKAGLVAGRVYNEAAVKELASLPGKDVLLGKLLGGLKQPVQKLHSALSSPLRNLATVLKAHAEKLPAA
ncbi:MAG TPA: 50S ribosomal protein L10 [Candidatus Eisenbacteria bacterium]